MQRIYTIFFPLLLLLLLCVGFAHPNNALTQDLGRHILLGEIITNSFSVPNINLLSYTYPYFSFINHHYLSEVVFYIMTSFFGMQSLLILTLFFVISTGALLFRFVRTRSSLIAQVIVSILLLRVLFERTDIRPEIFSFFFISIFITSLYAYRNHPSKYIFLLIPLSFLWTQMHIYFVIGYSLTGLFLLERFLVPSLRSKSQHTKTLALVFVGSTLVTVLNPNGLDGALYPFHVFQNYGYTIEENQTVFFLESLGFFKPSLPYFKLSIVLLLLSFLISWRKTKGIDWMLAGVFSLAGFLAVRNLPLFALIMFIPFTTSLSDTLTTLFQRFFSKKHIIAIPVVYLILCILLVWQINNVGRIHTIGMETRDPYRPALNFFIQNNLEGPLFNNFDSGSYILYRLYPNERVFVDGRPEAYPSSFFQNTYIPMQESPELFQTVSEAYNFNTIIFSHTDQTPWAKTFLRTIIHNPSWVTVYLDPRMIILVKDTPENNDVIAKYAMTFETLQFSSYDVSDNQSLLQAASFATTIDHTRLTKQVFSDILTNNPTFCPALYNLASILSQENDPSKVIYVSKYKQTCSQ